MVIENTPSVIENTPSAIENTPNNNTKYLCELCNFISNNKTDFTRHNSTAKHLKNVNSNGSIIAKTYKCNCGKEYKHPSGLCVHKKKCEMTSSSVNMVDEPTNHFVTTPVQIPSTLVDGIKPLTYACGSIQTPSILSTDAIYELLKEIVISNQQSNQQNSEFKQIIIEQQARLLLEISKNGASSNTNNTNTNINSNNTQVNINMFLNDHCKDAITLTKFIESVQPTFDDVMYMSNNGNVAGLTKVLKNALDGLEITKRPLHCTDVKRHTTWVKEADGWQKDPEQAGLKRMCSKVEHACLIKTMDIIQGDDNYLIDGTAEYEHVHKMMLEAGGGSQRQAHNMPIVMRNIEENIKLDKQQMCDTVNVRT